MTTIATDHEPLGPGPTSWPRWRVLERSVADRRRSLVAWAFGIGAYVGLIVAFWPSIRGSSEIATAIENYPDAIKDFFGGAAAFDYTRPGGFLNTQLFSLILPLLLSGFAIGYGASTVAGEEHSGQLDLVLALPIRRSRLIAEKVAAVALSVFALTVLSAAVIVGVGALVNLGVSTTNTAAACTGSGLVALLCGLLALTIGAGTGNRGLALGVSSAVFVAGYLLQALSGLVDALRPARILSPLYHANDTVPINNGFPGRHFALLAVVCVALAIIAVPLFQHRDISP
jgi:ABC-2 type transport system permease protein